MIDLICDVCGGNKLEFDATAVWNVNTQEFQYEICDGVWCNDCDDLVSVKEVKIVRKKNENINI